MATIIIPTPLRKFTDGAAEITIGAGNVQSAIHDIIDQYPGLGQHLLDDQGAIRSFIRIFVGDNDIQALDGAATSFSDQDTLSIIPAIAGGK